MQSYADIVRPVAVPMHTFARAHEPARLFDKASTEYLQLEAAAVTARPITMAAWVFNPSDDAAAHTILALADASAHNDYYTVYENWAAGGGTPNNVGSRSRDGTTLTITNTDNSMPVGTWFHAAAVFDIGGLDASYLNGPGGKGTSGAGVNARNLDRTAIGRNADASPDLYKNGSVFWPCTWKAALTDAEIAELASGVPPWYVRPDDIVSMPYMETLYDPYMDAQWTASGTTIVTPYRDWTPPRRIWSPPAAAAGGVNLLQGPIGLPRRMVG